MKFAMDPAMLYNKSLSEVFSIAENIGYPYIELSPREDFLPGKRGRRATMSQVKEVERAIQNTGVGLASVMVVYDWASPDPSLQKISVDYWKQAIEVVADVGCDRINTEFAGDPRRPLESEASFWRSVEDLLPILESKKIQVFIEPHPYDFVESGTRAADLIRGIRSTSFGYLYCTPHTFHLGGEIAEQIRSTRDIMGHVHIADTFRPFRIIVNPQNADVRVHQHLDVGQGEVDWQCVFETLASEHYEGVLTVCVFAWPDKAVESLKKNKDAVQRFARAAGLFQI